MRTDVKVGDKIIITNRNGGHTQPVASIRTVRVIRDYIRIDGNLSIGDDQIVFVRDTLMCRLRPNNMFSASNINMFLQSGDNYEKELPDNLDPSFYRACEDFVSGFRYVVEARGPYLNGYLTFYKYERYYRVVYYAI